jgi:hypothetical protein
VQLKAYDNVLGFLTKALVSCFAAKSAVRAVVVVVVLPLLQFLREEVGVVDDLAFEGSGLVIAEEEVWTSAKVGTLGEHLAGRALTQISVPQGPENLGTATFKIVGAPHMTPHMVSIGP